MTNRNPSSFASRRFFHGSLLALLTLGGLLAATEAEAQTCPPGKTCFYAPPILPEPTVAPQMYGGDFALHAIGSNVTGTFSVNGGAPVPFNAMAGTPLLIPVTGTQGVISGFLVPENRGAFIVADSPSIIVEQRVTAASWQSSATIKSHVVGLGTRFRAGAYSLNTPNIDDTGYDMLAFYAPTATTVTVTAPPGATAPFWGDGIPGLTHVFTLAAGQTYALRTRQSIDFDGALITSTEPISVVTGGRGWTSGCGDEGRDHLVPTNLLGTQFIVDDYPALLSETLRVVTDTDNTQVSINGVVMATINAGGSFQPMLSGVTFIETSQPAYVFQNAGMVQCELDIAMIPPAIFAPVPASSISVNVIGIGYTIMYIPSLAVSSILLDGAAPPTPQVALVPTHPEYSRVRFNLSEGNHVITAASDFQIGVVNFAPGATGFFAYFNPYRVATCSNGALDDGESCDDGNVDDGDGCSATCEVEGGFVCTGEPSVCTADPCLGVTCVALDECHDVGVCDPGTGLCSDPEKVNGSACDDGNACTQMDSCQAGACMAGTPVTCTASDQCHDVGVCDTATGVCSNPNKPNGSTCDDSNACTRTDTCQVGSCTGGNPVICLALDQCHDPGVCDTGTGVCSNPNKVDGTGCDDADQCTQTDSCQAGTCTGSNPVVCTASDQCHDVGICDPESGTCSNPNMPNGTTCSDSNACTQTDTCQGGTCTGANPVTCTALDQCHDVGVCDTATGVCSNPNKPNGTTCSDTNACTQTDTCQAGTCTGANPVTCTALDQCHDVGVCNTTTGVCSNPNKPDGTTCNDTNACTQTDTCQAGACNGGNPVTCTALDQCHDVGVCNTATGVCSNPNKPDGTSCTDSNACTQTDSCQAGTCNGGNPVTCTALDQCHDVGVCNTATGVCSNPNKPDGTSCTDSNACTQTDSCQAGTCNGGNPVTCTALDQCHDVGVCNTATGVCSNPNKADGTTCNDGSACTQTDTCQAGTCAGGNAIICTALDQCHDVGVCNAATGLCSNPNKTDGTSCNDSNACTQTDSCQAGTCTGSNGVICTALDQCHDVGVCDVATGACSNPSKADGTSCNDGSACTQGDACRAGICAGGTAITCTALDQCHDVGVCDSATGVCSNPAKAEGAACDDGNACTRGDACAAGTCAGSAFTCMPTACQLSSTCNGNGGCLVVNQPVGTPCPDDGNPCTADACDGAGTCAQFLAPDGTPCDTAKVCRGGVCGEGCFIDGAFVLPNTLNPTNRCQLCNPSSSTVAWSNQADGLECDNGDACTMNDVCSAGTCIGTPVTCTALDECHDVGICDPLTGCSNPPKADGTKCDDRDACTQTDGCIAGTCTGQMPVECMATDECHEVGICDPLTGICSDPVKPDGTECTDGLCQEGVCELTTSSSSGMGGEGGAGGGGGQGNDPLEGRGGGCYCAVETEEAPARGALALLGVALVSLVRRARRSKSNP